MNRVLTANRNLTFSYSYARPKKAISILVMPVCFFVLELAQQNDKIMNTKKEHNTYNQSLNGQTQNSMA